jgi:hypothetical protein
MMLLNDDRSYYEGTESIEDLEDVEYMQLAAENLDDAIRALRKWAGLGESDVLLLPGDRAF